MNFKKSIIHTTFALAMGTLAMGCISATATEQENSHVTIKIDKTNNQDAKVNLNVDGDAQAFVLPELAVGESKTITTDSGKTIIANQTEEGLSLDIDGKIVKLPPRPHKNNLSAHMQRVMPLHHKTNQGIQISGVELDENQQQIIKNAFIAAGVDKPVNFSKNSFMFITTDGTSDGKMSKHIKVLNGSQHTWVNGDAQDIEIIIDGDKTTDVHEISKNVIIIEEKED